MNKKVLIDKQALIDELLKIPGVGSNSDALETIKRFPSYEPQKPLVPKCFDIDYKKYKYMENNKPEILLTAMGGIYRVSFSGSFRDLSPNVWKTGIKWNKWTKETILWASRNYADFCQAVISGDYEVEKEPLYHVKLKIPGATYYLIQTFLMPGDTHMCFSAATERYGAKWKNTFTESEIKAIDERYWAFAVPVEQEEAE